MDDDRTLFEPVKFDEEVVQRGYEQDLQHRRCEALKMFGEEHKQYTEFRREVATAIYELLAEVRRVSISSVLFYSSHRQEYLKQARKCKLENEIFAFRFVDIDGTESYLYDDLRLYNKVKKFLSRLPRTSRNPYQEQIDKLVAAMKKANPRKLMHFYSDYMKETLSVMKMISESNQRACAMYKENLKLRKELEQLQQDTAQFANDSINNASELMRQVQLAQEESERLKQERDLANKAVEALKMELSAKDEHLEDLQSALELLMQSVKEASLQKSTAPVAKIDAHQDQTLVVDAASNAKSEFLTTQLEHLIASVQSSVSIPKLEKDKSRERIEPGSPTSSILGLG